MQKYNVTLTGLTPFLMHADNLSFGEKIAEWRRDPGNKEHSVSGDDRSPPWSWLGYAYHNKKILMVPADNIMTMLREGGAKVKTGGKNGETYKKHTQSGIMIDGEGFDILVDGETIPIKPFDSLIGNLNFVEHIAAAESAGFELLVKRARVGQAKHVRVRPMLRNWRAVGSLTVLDPDTSGLTAAMIDLILRQAGALVGLGDWRPSSPKASGTFGKFSPKIEAVKGS